MRAVAGIATGILLSAGVAVATVPAPAHAADATTFDASRIIDDSLFYDGSRMPEAAIQQFIDAKENCRATAGNPGCLENYRSSTADRAADS